MFNFNEILFENEKILYEGKPVPGKNSNGIKCSLAIIVFTVSGLGLMIWSLVTKTGDAANGINMSFILIMLLLLLLLGIAIYLLIYNLFFKKEVILNDIYCLTNMRALKYEINTKNLIYGYLIKYDQIETKNQQNNYGDLYMGILAPENLSPEQQLLFLKENLFNQKPDDMPCITFESIENPKVVETLALHAQKELRNNQNQQNYVENN